ncbi:hypothetical protein [Mycobacteroides salmoniphilum]|uniref:ESX-1 secretion-associated protein EspD n=1 Tax=Mycobacteroides salmoniphilum TaxID=404941 RepID=A0A4R8SZZ9_9MYCO|nr:hypothetical protein [Mycobacteroides salmoniphilum]TEA09169.1 hypothetical protein CCUG60884_00338 [Mycobacteroides salmoniphilum]
MSQPGEGLPPQPQMVVMSNPSSTITVRDMGCITQHIGLKPAALHGTEASLAKEILGVAGFSRDKSRALEADRLVAESVANGDSERACSTYLHKELHMPTHDDVEQSYAAHYQQPNR